MEGIHLIILRIVARLLLLITLREKPYWIPCCTDQEAESQRGLTTCLRPHSCGSQQLGDLAGGETKAQGENVTLIQQPVVIQGSPAPRGPLQAFGVCEGWSVTLTCGCVAEVCRHWKRGPGPHSGKVRGYSQSKELF